MSYSAGLEKIQDWTKQSLKTRLKKSLAHDWIPEKTSHKFPLRQYYVQLEWKQKIRTAMGSKTVTLTSIHDLIKVLTMSNSDAETQGAEMGCWETCSSCLSLLLARLRCGRPCLSDSDMRGPCARSRNERHNSFSCKHDAETGLIRPLRLSNSEAETPGAGASHGRHYTSSVIIEGKTF